MLYQKLLTGSRPYFCSVGSCSGFEEHRHPDVEICYCLSGSYQVIIDRQCYLLEEGDMAVVGCMVSHEIPYGQRQASLNLTLEVGPVFLKDYFEPLAETVFRPVYHLAKDSDLRRLLEETAELYGCKESYAELLLTGNLYKISAFLCRECTEPAPEKVQEKLRRPAVEIEKALELIYSQYAQNITLEDAAAITGYSKSNFCTVFKNMVGDSFHQVLNRHRVENACYFLRETTTTISDIAVMVGFADAKSFCRVFKSFYGVSPGTYRLQEGPSISRS